MIHIHELRYPRNSRYDAASRSGMMGNLSLVEQSVQLSFSAAIIVYSLPSVEVEGRWVVSLETRVAAGIFAILVPSTQSQCLY